MSGGHRVDSENLGVVKDARVYDGQDKDDQRYELDDSFLRIFFMYTACAQRDAQPSDLSFHAMQVVPDSEVLRYCDFCKLVGAML